MTKREIKNLIGQTAKDYCMEIWEVERIYNKYSMDEFYAQLELALEEKKHK